VRRRDFITLLGGAAAWPLAARAQQPSDKLWRVGFIGGARPPGPGDPNPYEAFRQGMSELRYVEGRNLLIEWRFAEGRYEQLSAFATELVQMNVDVIVLGTSAAVRPVQQVTTTIPIVMGSSTDPVGSGFVASLARPGGNITGLATSFDDTSPKQIELLMATVPNLSRIGLLLNPGSPNHQPILANVEAAAKQAGAAIVMAQALRTEDLPQAFETLQGKRADALMVIPDALFFARQQEIAELALKYRLPSIFSRPEYVQSGGLMSYGQSLADFLRRTAYFVDRIFKGAKPADLPIEQPTRFLLTINLKTARALGLDIPPTLLARADEVIE
jgi:putative ABC transport system substrate-binding protein